MQHFYGIRLQVTQREIDPDPLSVPGMIAECREHLMSSARLSIFAHAHPFQLSSAIKRDEMELSPEKNYLNKSDGFDGIFFYIYIEKTLMSFDSFFQIGRIFPVMFIRICFLEYARQNDLKMRVFLEINEYGMLLFCHST